MSQGWSGGFISALGAGSVLGSLRRSRHTPWLRLAATVLAALGLCMVVFVSAPWVWMSFAAALAAGVTCLLANSMTRTLLSQTAGVNQASVMAVWAIAWAGSKPLASITDGLLAGWIGVWPTGMILALPAFLPIAVLAALAGLEWEVEAIARPLDARRTGRDGAGRPGPHRPGPHRRGPHRPGADRPARYGPADQVGGDVVRFPGARVVTAVTAESITAIELDTRQRVR